MKAIKPRMTIARVAVAALALGALLGFAQSAAANSSGISGTGTTTSVSYYDTPYQNTYAQSQVFFSDGGNGAGGCNDIAIRGGLAHSGTYARLACGPIGSYRSLVHDGTGALWQPAGTFYISIGVNGGCGGSGCGTVPWSGSLEWNIKYLP